MEMPTPCNECGSLFYLLDGKRSPKTKKIIICEACADAEQEEIEHQEEIDDLEEQISEAEHAIINARKRLQELNKKGPVTSPSLARILS